ncbi:tetratricopeptide repeat protein [Marinobacter sp. chi1]|uniref:Tetratricopeptide repeat protein n=1 Tax=Marinobacter suaedae TaxID=3057675 RepID=A0ABT8W2A1_9GAMM|nr:tetratricopeptide repeat protein [Marinobacter sp. chi1]MDO3722374.1 tetratricopeptide repeat protein [Marinobacter sp. chi1]
MKRLVAALLCSFGVATLSWAQEAFRVELGGEGETIGDMRPVFLPFESRPMPAISPAEVARRYQKLFRSSDEPEVRIDALNRLSNIQTLSGEDIGFTPEEETAIYREAIGSYESIIGRGSYSGRLDELLYQMAKAHALTGQADESITRLKQLAGLYPKSPFAPEARFRVAESAFASGNYPEAEAEYRAVLDQVSGDSPLGTKVRFMMGWSQFKQGVSAWNRAADNFIRVLDGFLPDQESLLTVDRSSVDTIDDTLRVLAMMAARTDGAERLYTWLDGAEDRYWTYVVFDRLADYYAVLGQYTESVAANQAFVDYFPNHPRNPAFLAQVADVWLLADKPAKVRAAKANYVAQFASPDLYQTLSGAEQERWLQFSRELADFHYHSGSRNLAAGNRVDGQQDFSTAASFYEALAGRTEESGEVLRLAGDARLQSGQYSAALIDFQESAYTFGGYPEAADAGWAAIVLLREGLDGQRTSPGFRADIDDLAHEAVRFEVHFSGDGRLAGLLAELSVRWFERGELEKAIETAQKAVLHPGSNASERYAAWQVVAKVRQHREEFSLAEQAWNNVLEQLGSGEVSPAGATDARAAQHQLATVIYRQGEVAAEAGNVDAAVNHFERIESALPGSEIAIKGRYDAANTLLIAHQYAAAIDAFTRFRADFPDHSLTAGISDKLVHAHVSAGDPAQAADELLLVARSESNPWPTRLKAAALYHEGGAIESRNTIYTGYLGTSPVVESADHHVLQQTMRQRLIASGDDPLKLQEAIVASELDSQWHSEETLAWAARSALILGARAAATFTGIRLTHPLADSLDRKQVALESARQRFLEAEKFGDEVVRSESLYRRAELYRGLAQDLMASSVPDDLNEMEAMQYQMLLEEEAYPFEEKAIRLHSDNHQRIASIGFNAWIGRSLDALAKMNPGRYDRTVRWMSWAMEVNDGA